MRKSIPIPAARWALVLALGLGLGACVPAPDDETAIPPPTAMPATARPETDFAGTILFQSDMDGDNEIYGLTRDGVRKFTDNAWSDEYPRWSPDGARLAFAANPRGQFDIFVMNRDGSDIRAVADSPADETEPAWLPDGTGIAFTKDDALWAIDLRTRQSRRVLPDFSRAHGLSDWSRTAPLVAFTGKRTLGWDVFVYDQELRRPAPLTDGGQSCRPRFSPDGRAIAFVSAKADGKGDVWTMKPDGSEKTRLTERDATSDYFPAWSPDGKDIVFSSSSGHSPKTDRWALYFVGVSSGRVRPLYTAAERALFPDWSDKEPR